RVVVPAGGDAGIDAAVVVEHGPELRLDAPRVEGRFQLQVAVADQVAARARAVAQAAAGRSQRRAAAPGVAGRLQLRVQADLTDQRPAPAVLAFRQVGLQQGERQGLAY